MNATQVKGIATRGLIVGCAAALTYGVVRFESIQLPSNGCSPVHGVEPGARLIVDTWAREPGNGELVLYRGDDGALYLGRVQPFPPGESLEAAVWVLGERADCPSRDSRELGPIAADSLAGRIVYVHS